MSDVLARIKAAMLDGRYDFSLKARLEMQADALTDRDLVESILNATRIHKSLRSASPYHRGREMLHVIIGPNARGINIYSKGKLSRYAGREIYYFFVSAKRAV